jgi:hypothetical protein
MDNEIEKRFTTIPHDQLSSEKLGDLERLSDAAKAYTEALRTFCPPSRERALAETNAEQAAMWASKAVTHTPSK